MGFDSRASQGSDSPEGSDASPGGTGVDGEAVPGGYPPPPGFATPPSGSWQPPTGPPPPGPPAYGQPAYGAPSYPTPPPGGYTPPPPLGYGPPPPVGYGGYQSGYVYSGPSAPRTDGTAIATLVLAICSFLVCPIIPAVIALAMVPASRRTILASGGSVSGLGVLTATKVIAWINIGLGIAAVAIIVIAAIVTAASDTSNALSRVLTF